MGKRRKGLSHSPLELWDLSLLCWGRHRSRNHCRHPAGGRPDVRRAILTDLYGLVAAYADALIRSDLYCLIPTALIDCESPICTVCAPPMVIERAAPTVIVSAAPTVSIRAAPTLTVSVMPMVCFRQADGDGLVVSYDLGAIAADLRCIVVLLVLSRL